VAKIDLQYDLINYTPASASPVEANFNRIEQHINQEVVERGGTVAMTAQLKLVGDPVAELDAAPKQYVDQVLPIGIVMMFGGTVVPPGGRWAMCNGAEMQTALYPALFAIIGANFSLPGTPAGRFNLPNLNGRFPMGATPGATGGARDSVLPAHTHSHDHSHDDTHTHGTFNTGPASADHFHAYSGGTFSENAQHYHLGPGGTSSLLSSADNGNPIWILADGGNRVVYAGSTHWEAQEHQHGYSGNTGGISANHFHAVSVSTYNGRTAHEGGATANAGVAPTDGNLPPYLGLSYIMRVT
jgi:microcystin-dependent protein